MLIYPDNIVFEDDASSLSVGINELQGEQCEIGDWSRFDDPNRIRRLCFAAADFRGHVTQRAARQDPGFHFLIAIVPPDSAMPDRRLLKPGDRIRILAVPDLDLQQRERELASNAELAGWTADTIERIIATCPFVTVDRIDKHGTPWFRVDLDSVDGNEHHSLGILDDESWTFADN